MHRLALAVVFLFVEVSVVAQNPKSDPQAISLAQQSMVALTGGVTITDVTLNANVISTFGTDYQTGSGILRAKGTGESRVDLTLTNGTRVDVRNISGGAPTGAWVKDSAHSIAYAQHNCWADAVWFFPSFSSLTQTANPSFVFKYIGREQHGGVATQHIAIFQTFAHDPSGSLQGLTTMHFYLDPNSNLPLDIAFQVHPDSDMSSNIPTEVRFANYQPVSGIQVPFHVQSLLDGAVTLDVTITSAAFNAGLQDNLFTLP